MSEVREVDAAALCWRCDPSQFEFPTTDELGDLDEILGQMRALDAIQFGIGMQQQGYNLYVLGPPGVGKRTSVQKFVEQKAAKEERPADWCYVNNFEEPYKPRALRLPPGRGVRLGQAMQDLVGDLRTAVPATLESEEYRGRLQQLQEEFEERHRGAFEKIAEKAESQSIRLIRTPGGFAFAPTRNGEVLSPEDFEKLSDEERKSIEQAVTSLQDELQKTIEKVPKWRKQTKEKISALKREVTQFAIGHSIAQVKHEFADLPHVMDYLEQVEQDVVEHADQFHPPDEEPTVLLGLPLRDRPSFHRYEVNVLVDNSERKGAPVVYEDHPNFHNLVGRVEHRTHMGSLITDFTLIKSGALHRANGGYLVVEALKILREPYTWEALKRALYAKQIKVESLGEILSLVTTVSLEPEAIPLDVKIVLLGDRLLYYLLYQYDPEFAELFKVAADFDEEIDRSPENCQLYARFVATLVHREKLRPFDRSAVAQVIEHSARLAGDSEKLSTHLRSVADVMREADHWASLDNAPQVTGQHVQQTVDHQIYRADRLNKRLQEEIQRGTILIDTEGEQVGQVNGLSVIDLGSVSFGRPSRITATARLGKGEVIDIEREVELGGSIHSKGVFILSAFLAARYAKDCPLSLTANLVFEQSYGTVEGDSASVGELCALLSALAEVPIRQTLAVTGSVNQHGQVQAIGGVNEKIEGFFDVCRQRGLTGEQGVLIPSSNVKHLMLRRDVVEAAAQGQFHVYPVANVDAAISLLTGLSAGEADPRGQYPAGTLNQRVASRLQELSRLRQEYGLPQKSEMPHE